MPPQFFFYLHPSLAIPEEDLIQNIFWFCCIGIMLQLTTRPSAAALVEDKNVLIWAIVHSEKQKQNTALNE